MSALRWILLVLGIAVIAAVYLLGRRQERHSRVRREPELIRDDTASAELPSDLSAEAETQETDEADLIDFDEVIVRGLETELADFRPKKPEPEEPVPPPRETKPPEQKKNGSMLLEQELVVLNLFANDGDWFDGDTLYAALHNAGFDWNEDRLFHCRGQHGEYLALNALKPGTFPDQPAEFNTRAVALILQLSTVEKPVAAFDEFLGLARQLQSDLDARLCDGQRSSLTRQTISFLHDEVRQYQFKHR